MVGERRFSNPFGRLELPPGGYGRDLRGRWWARAPGADALDLRSAHVHEHEDETITVGLLVVCTSAWAIERGMWRAVT